MKKTIFGFFFSLIFSSSAFSEKIRTDIRHWSEDIYAAAPSFEDFEDFLSDFEPPKNHEELDEEERKYLSERKELESIDKSQEGIGRAYHIDRKILELSLKISTIQKMKAEYKLFYQSRDWRLQSPEARQKIVKQAEIENNSLKCVDLARVLVNRYSFEPDFDQYLLIRLLGRTQNSNVALFYEQFKAKFSNSKFFAHVNQIMAEYYLQKLDFDRAETHLKTILDSKESLIRPYAIYKLGWIHILRGQRQQKIEIRQEELKKAIVAFRLSIKLMKDWDGYSPTFKLEKEAARDLSWLLAELRIPKEAVKSYFEESEQVRAYSEYLNYLAVDALRDNEFQLAESAFLEIIPIQKETSDQRLPHSYLNQIELFTKQRAFDKILETYKLTKNLFVQGSEWQKQWMNDRIFLEHEQNILANHIIFTANTLQDNAESVVNTGASASDPNSGTIESAKLLVMSKNYYDLFMNWYPNSESQDSAQYNYALLMMKTGDNSSAARIFSEIMHKNRSEFRQQASFNQIIALINIDGALPQKKLPEAGKVRTPISLPTNKSQIIEKIDAHAVAWPNDPQNAPALYTAAMMYHEFGHYDQANKRFDSLIKFAPKSAEAESSLNTLLSYLVEKNRWKELIPLCKEYLSNRNITRAGHRKLIRQTLNYAKLQAPEIN